MVVVVVVDSAGVDSAAYNGVVTADAVVAAEETAVAGERVHADMVTEAADVVPAADRVRRLVTADCVAADVTAMTARAVPAMSATVRHARSATTAFHSAQDSTTGATNCQ
jgi:hypothetical protein